MKRAGEVLPIHQRDAQLRAAKEESGEDMVAPHACGHGAEFKEVATNLDRLRDAIIGELNRVELPRKKGCDTQLKKKDPKGKVLGACKKNCGDFIKQCEKGCENGEF